MTVFYIPKKAIPLALKSAGRAQMRMNPDQPPEHTQAQANSILTLAFVKLHNPCS
jgi:hypothetical protein